MPKQATVYGYISGSLSVLLFQPLDNIKMAYMFPPNHIKKIQNKYMRPMAILKYMFQQSGIKGFYSGLYMNLLKSSFASSLYFWLLRTIEQYRILQSPFNSSFIASFFSRMIATVASNPLNVVETRYQMIGSQRMSGSIYPNIKKIHMEQGIHGFYKGCLANCYKQGLFAGCYYSMYVYLKHLEMNAMMAGMIAGMIATYLTHPLEIIRVQYQLNTKTLSNSAQRSTLTLVRELVQTGRALKGVTPRLIKKPLANTISFTAFEYMQRIKFLQNH